MILWSYLYRLCAITSTCARERLCRSWIWKSPFTSKPVATVTLDAICSRGNVQRPWIYPWSKSRHSRREGEREPIPPAFKFVGSALTAMVRLMSNLFMRTKLEEKSIDCFHHAWIHHLLFVFVDFSRPIRLLRPYCGNWLGVTLYFFPYRVVQMIFI